MKQIYTIGSSVRNWEECLNILRHYKVEILIDIRRFPTSRWAPHFKKENLKKLCKKANIEYLWMGEELGGFRKGGYEKFMETETFKKGIRQVEKLAKKKRVGLMCAEKFPWQCHRALVGQKLKEIGFSVIHIIEKNKTWLPKEGEKIKPKCEKH